MQKVFPEAILNKLSVSNNVMTQTTRNYLFFTALILMVIALSRPVINQQEHTIKQEITPIVVAIDVSKSMLANDIFPNRLSFAKNKLLKIIEKSQHNALGVLLFAKSAFILSPITKDFTSLNYLVKNFDQGLNFDNGSNLYALIEAANKLLKNYSNKNLLILSDGANGDDFSKEITLANEKNITVYTLATASNTPTPIKIGDQFLSDDNDNIVTVSLNENIKALSLNTNGGYIKYTLDDSDIDAILSDIEHKSDKESIENQKFKTYTELFYYPLALAILLLLIAFSSLPRKRANLLLLSLIFLAQDNHASILDFQTIQKANEAYQSKDFKTATKEFKKVSQSSEGHYNLANALYKQNKYSQALTEYKKVVTSNKELEYKKLHNMGNSYVKTKQLEDAKKMYEKALQLKNDAQTKENLEVVNKALKKKKDKNNQDSKDNQKKNKDNKDNKKSKKEDKNSKDNKSKKEQNQTASDNASKEKKEPKENKENQENKESQKADSNNKKDENKKSSKAQNKEASQKNQTFKQNQMSDLEEKKWMNKLNNQPTPILLRKVPSQAEENTSSTPW